MAGKAKNNQKQGLIIGICLAIVAIVVIIVIIVAIMANKNSGLTGLNDSYFVSDGTKYVITLDGDEIYIENGLQAPTKYHLVYTYDGDNLTGLKTYYQYDNAEIAKDVYEYFLTNATDYYEAINLDGNYVILTVPASDYEGVTISDVRQQIDLLESTEDYPTGEVDIKGTEETEDDIYYIEDETAE